MNPEGAEISYYGDNFTHLSEMSRNGRANTPTSRPPDIDLMYEAASSIGGFFDYARIDLYNPSPGVVYLGEITLCPGSGHGSYSPGRFEEELGADWDMGKYVKPI